MHQLYLQALYKKGNSYNRSFFTYYLYIPQARLSHLDRLTLTVNPKHKGHRENGEAKWHNREYIEESSSYDNCLEIPQMHLMSHSPGNNQLQNTQRSRTHNATHTFQVGAKSRIVHAKRELKKQLIHSKSIQKVEYSRYLLLRVLKCRLLCTVQIWSLNKTSMMLSRH